MITHLQIMDLNRAETMFGDREYIRLMDERFNKIHIEEFLNKLVKLKVINKFVIDIMESEISMVIVDIYPYGDNFRYSMRLNVVDMYKLW